MPWPLPQDYNEALQNPETSFRDPELRRGQVVVNALGIPQPCSGNFADVYAVECPATRNKWAVKCFTREVHGLRERYSEISRYLQQVHLPFMVDFQYQEQGIRIAGRWYPILKMHWVEGLALNTFVRDMLDKPSMLEKLSRVWVRMARRLRGAGLAHCDLQHGNILLVPDSEASALAVKLIDYDGMWVPALANVPSGEVGHPAYQHPRRRSECIYNSEVDRFPLLVIHAALRTLIVGGRPLWDRYDTGDNLLFRQADFEAPTKSRLFAELLRMNHPEIRTLVVQLIDAARMPLEQTPNLADLIAEEKSVAAPVPHELAPAAARTWTAAATPVPLVASDEQSPAASPWLASEATTEEPNPFQDIERIEVTSKRHSSLIPWMVAGGVAACALIGAVLFWGARPGSQPEKTGITPQQRQVNADTKAPANTETDRKVSQLADEPSSDESSPLPPDKSKRQALSLSSSRQVEYSLSPSVRMVFCWIPAGKSRLGSPPGEARQADHKDESEHDFSTLGFWLGKYEVTQADWLAVMGKNPSVHDGQKPPSASNNVTGMDTSRFPVEDISWEDAQQFIKALNARAKTRDVFEMPGRFAVPTEDEWEYACRGGKGNADPFYFGKTLNGRQANCDGKTPYGTAIQGPSLGRPTVVGSYASEYPHPWGLCDMHGNVWEFCDSDRPRRAGTRVLRGGCWSRAMDCRAANRNFFGPDTNHYENVGVRVCFRPDGLPMLPIKPPPVSQKKNVPSAAQTPKPSNPSPSPPKPKTQDSQAKPAEAPASKPEQPPLGGKLPAPDDETQKKAAEDVRDIYKADYAALRQADERVALAGKLLKRGMNKGEEPARRFAYLSEARDLAARGGDLALSLRAIDEITKTFAVEPLPMKAIALELAVKALQSTDAGKNLLGQALTAADEAESTDDYEQVAKLLKIAQSAAFKSGDPYLPGLVTQRQSRRNRLQEKYAKIADAVKTLADKPDDAEANLTVGKFQCFDKEDWRKGLPMLERGSDSTLAELARKDRANPTAAPAESELGYKWWEFAEKQTDAAIKSVARRRARFWFCKALPLLEGDDKVRVVSRLEKKVGRLRLLPGLVTELFAGDNFEKRVKTRLDYQINYDWGTGAPDQAVPADHFSIRWQGVLIPPQAGKYKLTISRDDDARLVLDGNIAIDWGGKSVSSEVLLSGQPHALLLEFREATGPARVHLLWSLEGGFKEQAIPLDALYHDVKEERLLAP